MIAEIALSLLLVWLTWSVVTTYKTRSKMPPGPFPYPFVGNFPQMLCDSADPFGKLAEKYGDIYTLPFPTGNTVVLNTASLVREARSGKKAGVFVGRSPGSVYPFTEMLGDDYIMTDYSPKYVYNPCFDSCPTLENDDHKESVFERLSCKIYYRVRGASWKTSIKRYFLSNDPICVAFTKPVQSRYQASSAN